MEKAEISIVVLLLVALLGRTQRPPLRFAEEYKNPSGWWWTKLIERRATFREAYIICQIEGRHLASPGQYVNNEVFEDVQQRYPDGIWTDWIAPSNSYYRSRYLGENMTAFLKHYVRVFEENQPHSIFRCLVSLPYRRVRDSNCKEELPFICSRWGQYWRFGNTACNSYDKEYNLLSTGSCYKFHRNGMEWQAALIKCRAEGGELAIVDSYSEIYVLNKMLIAAEKDMPKSGYGSDVAYVGIYYYHTHKSGRWITIHGENLPPRSPMIWYKDEPANSCGGWSVHGFYVALNCGMPHRFICEKKPNTPL